MIQKNKLGIIYKIVNMINGKIYIGMTKNSLKERFNQHKCDANKNSNCPIHRAIRKYGIENFNIFILEKCSIEKMPTREVFYIKKFKSTNSKLGYNASNGGESGKTGVPGWNKGLTKENSSSLMKISEKQTGSNNSFYGKTHTDKLKKKWSSERCGKNHPLFGTKRPGLSKRNKEKIWTDEAKNKISAAKSIPIKCIQNNTIYKSIKEMCKILKLDNRSVHRVLSGKFKQHHGYSFIYAEEK